MSQKLLGSDWARDGAPRTTQERQPSASPQVFPVRLSGQERPGARPSGVINQLLCAGGGGEFVLRPTRRWFVVVIQATGPPRLRSEDEPRGRRALRSGRLRVPRAGLSCEVRLGGTPTRGPHVPGDAGWTPVFSFPAGEP